MRLEVRGWTFILVVCGSEGGSSGAPFMRLEKAFATAVCEESGWRATNADDTDSKAVSDARISERSGCERIPVSCQRRSVSCHVKR